LLTLLHQSAAAETIYEKLTDEEDARACRDISETACQVVPGNFLLILSASVLTKLGDAMTSPKTVLAWVASSAGVPAGVLGLLVPVREAGSLVPQLLIGGFVRRIGVRKWAWVLGSVLQAIAVLGMAWTAMNLTGTAAGAGLLGSLVLFSLARGLCSVAAKDVLGKTVPRGRRGQLAGWSAGAAGVISAVVGMYFLREVVDGSDPTMLAALLAIAAGLWLCAGSVYSLVREEPGETDGGANGILQALNNLKLLVNDIPFRRFVLARSLLMCSGLSAPYFVALAHQQNGARGALLGAFIVAGGCASLISAPIWGRMADQSSRRVMFIAACLCALVGGVVFTIGARGPEFIDSLWTLPSAYFVLSVAHDGIRVGRKTYVVDMAEGNRRTDYVSVSNSVIGVLLLLAGFAGLLAEHVGSHGMIGLFAVMGLIGAMMTLRLPQT
jgi:MFS family permease